MSTHGVARRGGNLGEGVRVGHTSTHRPLLKCFNGLPYGLSIRCSTNCHEQVAAGAALRRCQVLLQGDTGKGLLDHAKRCHPPLASTKELMRLRRA